MRESCFDVIKNHQIVQNVQIFTELIYSVQCTDSLIPADISKLILLDNDGEVNRYPWPW